MGETMGSGAQAAPGDAACINRKAQVIEATTVAMASGRTSLEPYTKSPRTPVPKVVCKRSCSMSRICSAYVIADG